MNAGSGPLEPAARGETVSALQSFLTGLKWYPFMVDGEYGPRTSQGVQQLQRAVRDAGFDPGPIDGWFGVQTRSAACAWLAG